MSDRFRESSEPPVGAFQGDHGEWEADEESEDGDLQDQLGVERLDVVEGMASMRKTVNSASKSILSIALH